MSMTFNEWRKWFEFNKNSMDSVPADCSPELSMAELDLITHSIQQFQRGEYSEGKNLLKFAKQWGRTDYVEAIKVFIREEQRHAIVLGEFMKAEGIERISDHWVDDTFRFLRKYLGLENSIRILGVAEIIAVPYYAALHDCTNSRRLKAICKQILRDEHKHLQFQAETIEVIGKEQTMLRREIANVLQAVLMLGTIMIVWIHHRRILKKGGYSFLRFLRECVSLFVRLVGQSMGERTVAMG
ncbi:MAG: ferritin-like domain-containing protein [Flavobacteriales bacterium]|nr:ferritin-like domain-containing protein [Flavobacteriales bacterium]